MKKFTRRDFLKTAAVGAAAFSTNALSWGRAAGANDDIRVAQIGFRSQGAGHVSTLSKMKGVRLVALCDVDRHVLDKKSGELGGGIQTYTDIRKLLENKDVDAVSIAIPNLQNNNGVINNGCVKNTTYSIGYFFDTTIFINKNAKIFILRIMKIRMWSYKRNYQRLRH